MKLSKVFDTVNHELLIAKLDAYGFSIEALEVLLTLFVPGCFRVPYVPGGVILTPPLKSELIMVRQ